MTRRSLPVLRLRVSRLPTSLLALIVASPATLGLLGCSAASNAPGDLGGNGFGGRGGAGAGGVAGKAGGASGAGGSAAAAGTGGASGASGKGGNAGSGTSGQAGQGGVDPGCGDTELCDNGADDNCDGQVDEGCLCVPGQIASCFRGTLVQRGHGICRDGKMVCAGPQEFGAWLPCEGDTLPEAEICDAGLLDENCSGTANESCECEESAEPVACGSSVGECQPGTQACVGGTFGKCLGGVGPALEVCDGKDNDCDGLIDEDLSRVCGESVGICSPGVQSCVDGQYGACVGAVQPSEEVCNSLDDDCDGSVDEDVVVACGTAEGACKIGLRTCDAGILGACVGAIDPVAETCNGLDDDCDGQTDEGLDVVCGTEIGACSAGVSKCTGGVLTTCQGAVGPAKEICDTLDNDCDGTVDQGCGCTPGSPPVACGSTVGACKSGTQSCVGGALGPCVGAITPLIEVCNNVDDDCDGTVDESVTRLCGSAVGACKQGVETCDKGAFGACVGAVGPVDEICNGLDDDCDGLIDEGLVRGCGSDVGRCIAGVQICDKGVYGICLGGTLPITEICDGAVDEDCDGVVDNGCACPVGKVIACGKNIGACKPGTQTCGAEGTYGPCVGSTEPTVETCDSVDNDCDGAVDEDCGCSAGEQRACGTNVGECRFGKETCSLAGTWGPCVGGKGATLELCDGLDSNCDGDIDTACECLNGAKKDCGQPVGVCTRGKQTCNLQGQYGDCTGGVTPSPEVCNNQDDDCNGVVDDDGEGGGLGCFPAPIVKCQDPKTGFAGTAIALDASAMAQDASPLSYSWSVLSAPKGADSQPVPANTKATSFTPKVEGSYVLKFCATAASAPDNQACCNVTIEVASGCAEPPTKPVVETCGTSWDRRPIVTFPPPPAGIVYAVYAGATKLGETTMSGQNYFRPSVPIGPGDIFPGQATTLTVKACKADNRLCCTASETGQTKLIAACTTTIAASAENVRISEYMVAGQQGTQGTPAFQAAESIEITNLSACPVSLQGTHFGYQNDGTTRRWQNFGPDDVIPPRGVYVTIRNRAAVDPKKCPLPFLGAEEPGLFGLKISPLEMQGANLEGGWFNNDGGGKSVLRVASGAWVSITGGAPIAEIKPYQKTNQSCVGVGYQAVEACGDFPPGAVLESVGTQGSTTPNQLGRLWHPCDRVKNPVPAACKLVVRYPNPEVPREDHAPLDFCFLVGWAWSLHSRRIGAGLDDGRD